jgi:hypothetical protein
MSPEVVQECHLLSHPKPICQSLWQELALILLQITALLRLTAQLGGIGAPAEDAIAIESGGDVGGGSEAPVPDVEDKPEEDEGIKAQEELKMFMRWLKKSPTRPFNFREVPVVYAEVLNKFIDIKDYDSARWYAERYLA